MWGEESLLERGEESQLEGGEESQLEGGEESQEEKLAMSQEWDQDRQDYWKDIQEEPLLSSLVRKAESEAASVAKTEKAMQEEASDQTPKKEGLKRPRQLQRAICSLFSPQPGWGAPDQRAIWGCSQCSWMKTGCPKCNPSKASKSSSAQPVEKKAKKSGEV